MYSVNDIWFFIICVSTFRNPRIEAYLQLPVAYRSLSRLSSAPDAKAFSLCSCLLELLLINMSFDILVLGSLSFQELLSTLKTVSFLGLFISPFFTITCAAEIVFLPLILNFLERPIWFQILSSSLLTFVNLSVSSCSH